jgi:hypothetical protein
MPQYLVGVDIGGTLLSHGTTVGTNAIVQQRGAKVGLVTTTGHNDAAHPPKRFVIAPPDGLNKVTAKHSNRELSQRRGGRLICLGHQRQSRMASGGRTEGSPACALVVSLESNIPNMNWHIGGSGKTRMWDRLLR